VPVRVSPSFAVLGPPEEIQRFDGTVDSYAFGEDGTLYTASNRPGVGSESEVSPTVVWMQNWPSLLKRQFGR
jgi:hypothetical protein